MKLRGKSKQAGSEAYGEELGDETAVQGQTVELQSELLHDRCRVLDGKLVSLSVK